MELKNVSKSYGENTVLSNLSLSFPDGSRTVISGVSGRGKTTLLRLLMGLEKPDAGEILAVPEHISAVFQEDRLPLDFTPFKCVKMTAPRGVSRETILSHLGEVGLAGHLNKPVRELSGGMRRRVAIVRAVLADCQALFFDEAFTGLDAQTRSETAAYVLRHTEGKTLVAVSHMQDDARLLRAGTISL